MARPPVVRGPAGEWGGSAGASLHVLSTHAPPPPRRVGPAETRCQMYFSWGFRFATGWGCQVSSSLYIVSPWVVSYFRGLLPSPCSQRASRCSQSPSRLRARRPPTPKHCKNWLPRSSPNGIRSALSSKRPASGGPKNSPASPTDVKRIWTAPKQSGGAPLRAIPNHPPGRRLPAPIRGPA